MVKIADIELGDFPLLLAPMEDVSDPPFRALCKEQGCDMMYTEFISVEGLIRDASKSVEKLDIYDYERPIGIQIFGANIESMVKAADIVERARPEVLDINFGCPVKKVVCKGAGAGILQDIGIKALSIHGRTRKQMYKGEADWTLIGRIKDNPRIFIPIFGNGDIDSPQKAEAYRNRYGVDGIMIGRAAIGNPWIFREIKHYFATGELLPPPDIDERVDAARAHLRRSIDWKGPKLGILEMRRHYTNYFRGLPGVKEYRKTLVSEFEPATLFATLEEMRSVYGEAMV